MLQMLHRPSLVASQGGANVSDIDKKLALSNAQAISKLIKKVKSASASEPPRAAVKQSK